MKRPLTTPIFRDVDTVAERRIKERQTSELGSDEVVLWTGRPKRGIVFTAWDFFLIPFSIVWFSLTMKAGLSVQSVNPKSDPGLLFFYIFPLVGFYFLIGRFIVDAWYRAKLRYIITNQRVILISGFPLGAGVTSLDRATVTLRLDERRDGRGTLQLTTSDPWASLFYQPMHACLGRPPHLFRVKDARHVFELLRK